MRIFGELFEQSKTDLFCGDIFRVYSLYSQLLRNVLVLELFCCYTNLHNSWIPVAPNKVVCKFTMQIVTAYTDII